MAREQPIRSTGEKIDGREYVERFKHDVLFLCERVAAGYPNLFKSAAVMIYQPREEPPAAVHSFNLDNYMEDKGSASLMRPVYNRFTKAVRQWEDRFDRFVAGASETDDAEALSVRIRERYREECGDASATGMVNMIIRNWYVAIAEETMAESIRRRYPNSTSPEDTLEEELTELLRQDNVLAGFIGLRPEGDITVRHSSKKMSRQNVRFCLDGAKKEWIKSVTANVDQYIGYTSDGKSRRGRQLGRTGTPQTYQRIAEWILIDALLKTAWNAEAVREGRYYQEAVRRARSVDRLRRSQYGMEPLSRESVESTMFSIVSRVYENLRFTAANRGWDDNAYSKPITIDKLLRITIQRTVPDIPTDAGAFDGYDDPLADPSHEDLTTYTPSMAAVTQAWFEENDYDTYRDVKRDMSGKPETDENGDPIMVTKRYIPGTSSEPGRQFDAAGSSDDDVSGKTALDQAIDRISIVDHTEFSNLTRREETIYHTLRPIYSWMAANLRGLWSEDKTSNAWSIPDSNVYALQAAYNAVSLYDISPKDMTALINAIVAAYIDKETGAPDGADFDSGKNSKDRIANFFRRGTIFVRMLLYVLGALGPDTSFDDQYSLQEAMQRLSGKECRTSLRVVCKAAPATRYTFVDRNYRLVARSTPQEWRKLMDGSRDAARDAQSAVANAEKVIDGSKLRGGTRNRPDPIATQARKLRTRMVGCDTLHAAEHVIIDASASSLALCIDTFDGGECEQ